MRRSYLLGGSVLAASLVIAIAISQGYVDGRPASLGTVGGAPAYEWNQPFLAWPDTGDLACETENGPCGPPFATLDPATKALGQPLRIPSLKVEIGKPGHHEVEIGQLAFARGVHTRTSFRIVNADPKVYRVAQPHVEFRSLVPGAMPFTGVARDRSRVQGVEPVVAILVWDVDWATEGAVMEIADLEVE